MDVLFLHGNYPGQFPQLAAGMARMPRNRVVFLTNRTDPQVYPLKGVEVRRFDRHRDTTPGLHPYLRSSERAILNGQGVIRALAELLREGFRPRLVIGHGGNGLLLFCDNCCRMPAWWAISSGGSVMSRRNGCSGKTVWTSGC